jgi:hypothetical protein
LFLPADDFSSKGLGIAGDKGQPVEVVERDRLLQAADGGGQ